jgi:hypothetical protein
VTGKPDEEGGNEEHVSHKSFWDYLLDKIQAAKDFLKNAFDKSDKEKEGEDEVDGEASL